MVQNTPYTFVWPGIGIGSIWTCAIRNGAPSRQAARSPRPALAITAYLISRDLGVPVSPGIVADQPVFESRLRALDESVARGERLFVRRCRSCHALRTVARAALVFPRTADGQVESLEGLLGRHRPGSPPLGWDDQPTADIIAFLMSRLAGQPVGGSSEYSP